jgi:hypothetical protein
MKFRLNVQTEGKVKKNAFYSKCGFQCHVCPAYRDNSQTEAERKKGSLAWDKYFGLHIKPDMVRCEGCQATEPWKTGNMLPDRQCPIRSCAVYNDLPTCAHCHGFPCSVYKERVPAAGLRQQREKAAHSYFSDEEYRKFIEPFEGQTHLTGLHARLSPEDIKKMKPLPAGIRFAPFPDAINLTSVSREDMQRLYLVLKKAFTFAPENYADHILKERKRPYVTAILWVIGLYGRLINESLMLENTGNQGKKECQRLVRKTDNGPHQAIQDAIETLSHSGIQVRFSTSKKNWSFTLHLEQATGYTAMLHGLQVFVHYLAGNYGEPVYAGSYNLKGKAFKLFSRIDMRGL